MDFLMCILLCIGIVGHYNGIVCHTCNGKGNVWIYNCYFNELKHKTSMCIVEKCCKMCNGSGIAYAKFTPSMVR